MQPKPYFAGEMKDAILLGSHSSAEISNTPVQTYSAARNARDYYADSIMNGETCP